MNSPVFVFRIYFWSALKHFWNHSQTNSIMFKSRHLKNTFYWYTMVTEHTPTTNKPSLGVVRTAAAKLNFHHRSCWVSGNRFWELFDCYSYQTFTLKSNLYHIYLPAKLRNHYQKRWQGMQVSLSDLLLQLTIT